MFWCAVPQGSEGSDLSSAVAKVAPVSVKVLAFSREPDGSMSKSQGSGIVLMAEGRVVTNAHVVAGSEAVFLVDAQGRDSRATIEKLSSVFDVAVLVPESHFQVPILELVPAEKIHARMEVFSIGYPLNQRQTVTRGTVRGSKAIEENFRLFELALAVDHGSSGAPVFSGDGRLVGMVVGSVGTAQMWNFAIPIQEVTVILDDLEPMIFQDVFRAKGLTMFDLKDISKMVVDEREPIENAVARYLKGDLMGALEQLDRLRKKNPSIPHAAVLSSSILARQGHASSAALLLEEHRKNYGDDLFVLFHLGRMYALRGESGDRKKAAEMYELVARRSPNLQVRGLAIERMGYLTGG